MAFICAVVIRGGRKPVLVAITSSNAEESGVLPFALMPIWQNPVIVENRKKIKKICFMVLGFDFLLPLSVRRGGRGVRY